jgi:hypothetical protein
MGTTLTDQPGKFSPIYHKMNANSAYTLSSVGKWDIPSETLFGKLKIALLLRLIKRVMIPSLMER